MATYFQPNDPLTQEFRNWISTNWKRPLSPELSKAINDPNWSILKPPEEGYGFAGGIAPEIEKTPEFTAYNQSVIQPRQIEQNRNLGFGDKLGEFLDKSGIPLMIGGFAAGGMLGAGGFGGAGAGTASTGASLGGAGTWLEGISAADLAAAGYTQAEIATLASQAAAAGAGGLQGSQLFGQPDYSQLANVSNVAAETPGYAEELARISAEAGGAGATTGATVLPEASNAIGNLIWGENAIPGLGTAIQAGGGLLTGGGGLGGYGNLLSTGANLLGGYLQGQSATEAAQTSADAQLRAAQIAAEAQRLQLPQVSNLFGTSTSTVDPQGRLTSVGTNVAPWLSELTGQITPMAGQALQATTPVRQGAQTLMGYGSAGLATTPEQAAAQWMQSQQNLLAGPRATEYAKLQQTLQNTGRAGLAIGGGGGMMAANPEAQAYYNALNQQNLELAARATAEGRTAQAYNAAALGTGADLYGTSFTPVGTVTNMLGGLNTLAEQPLRTSLAFGSPATAASAAGGALQGQGMLGAAQTMQQNANVVGSQWGNLLQGGARALQNYGQPVQQAGMVSYDPGKFRLQAI